MTVLALQKAPVKLQVYVNSVTLEGTPAGLINTNVSQERIKPGDRLKFDHGSHSYFVKVIDYDDYEILEKIPIHMESAKYYNKEYKRIDEKTGKRKVPKNR